MNVEWRIEFMTMQLKYQEIRDEEQIKAIKKFVSSYKKRGHSNEEIIEDLMESYELSSEEAAKYVKG